MPGQRNRMNKGTAVWKRAACEGNLVVLCSLYRMDQSLKSPHYEVPLYTNIGTLSFIYQVPRNQQSFELGSEPVCCAVISCSVMQLLCHPTLCNPIDCSPPDSFVHGVLQAHILEWVAMPFSRGSTQPRDQTKVAHIAGGLFIIWATMKVYECWNG